MGGIYGCVGVASGRGQQEVGVDSGWNLWVWLVGVVKRYPRNNY